MPAITRNQMKNSINNVPIVNLVKDVVPIRECAKGISYSNKKVNDSISNENLYLDKNHNCANDLKSELPEIDRKLRNNKRIDYSNMDMPTSILAKHTDSYYWCTSWNNYCDIVLDQLVYESRDPDYIFEEDYDDDEEPVEKKDISRAAIKKEVKQDLKENIVMNIDDETMNNIKNMKEFKMKILEKKQAKNMTYLPGGVNLVKDIIPTRECAKNISYN